MTSTLSKETEIFEDVSNPLDWVEEVFSIQDWAFDRQSEDELTVHVSGKHGQYRLHFLWQEEYSAMQFSCEMDVVIAPSARSDAAKALARMNSDIWLGHFDIREDIKIPRFRHTSLFRGMTGGSGAEHIEDLVDIALNECERYMPVFSLLSHHNQTPDSAALSLALMDSAGSA